MLKSKIKKLEKQLEKEKSDYDNNIYNRDVIFIKTWKDLMEVYGYEDDDPPSKRVKPTAKILISKELRNLLYHYYDDDNEEKPDK